MGRSITKKQLFVRNSSASSAGLSSPVGASDGGTGLTSYAIGDIIYASGATTLSKLAIGTASQQLRVNAGATALEYFTPTGGITGTDTRVVFFDGANNPVGDADFTWNKTTNKLNTTAPPTINTYEWYYADAGAGYNCLSIGNSQSAALPTALGGTFIGIGVGGGAATTGYGNTLVGRKSANGGLTGRDNISMGSASSYSGHAFNYTLYFGSSYDANPGKPTASNQAVFGSSVVGTGYNSFYFGQGASAVSGTPSGVTFNATPGTTAGGAFSIFAGAGSGADKAGGILTLGGGAGTGAGTIGTTVFKAPVVGASSSTVQSYATVLEITNSTTITTTDAVNYALGSTTGTKWGTATTQKQAFWNATPIVQPTTAYAAATLVGGAGTNITDTDTFDGYTLKQIVAALRGTGLLA